MNEEPAVTQRYLTRREILRGAASGIIFVSVGGVLTACGAAVNPSASASSSGPAGSIVPTISSPKAGGRIRVAASAGSTDNLNPLSTGGNTDYMAAYHLWDSLVLRQGGKIVLSLAESIEPNADGTVWTIRIRDGVMRHDGKLMTSDDVAFSMALLADPERDAFYSNIFSDVDVKAMRKRDARTVEVGLTRPRGDFRDVALSELSFVFPDGTTDFTKGIGSGPFKLVSYQAGRNVKLAANPDYWGGSPLLEELEIVALNDATTRLNALKGGEVEFADDITAAGAIAEASNTDIEVMRGGPGRSTALMFTMNVTKPPFDNPNVRRGMRLVVDREAMVDNVLFGLGTVGNDLVGLGLPGYDETLPQRKRDLDMAAKLFADAGVTELTLKAGDIAAGVVDAAELLVQQLSEAGVTATIEKVPGDTYFNDFAAVLDTPFQSFFFDNRPIATHLGLWTGSKGAINVTGIATADYDRSLAAAQATVDDGERSAAFQEIQRKLYEEGGEVVWGYKERIAGGKSGITGVDYSGNLPVFGKATAP